jgi:hypothetical protein
MASGAFTVEAAAAGAHWLPRGPGLNEARIVPPAQEAGKRARVRRRGEAPPALG